MKLENIEYFLTVVESGSINKAAEKLFITQQSLGLIIKRMEQELGMELFVRDNKGITLTEQGKKFLPCARTLVSTYKAFLDETVANQDTFVLRLYTTPILAEKVNQLQSELYTENCYISIHKRSLKELSNMLEHRTIGVYFIPIMPEYQDQLERYKEKEVVIAESQQAYYCYKENPVLKQNHTLEYILENNNIIMNAQYDEAKLGNNMVAIDDMTLCKQYMREKNFLFCGMPLMYQQTFDDEEWVCFARKDISKVEFTLFFCLPEQRKYAEIKSKLVDTLRSAFGKDVF